jgi:hypothetical protein
LQTYVLVKHFSAKKGSAEGNYQVDYKTKWTFLEDFTWFQLPIQIILSKRRRIACVAVESFSILRLS